MRPLPGRSWYLTALFHRPAWLRITIELKIRFNGLSSNEFYAWDVDERKKQTMEHHPKTVYDG